MLRFAKSPDVRGVFRGCDSLLTDDRAARVQVRDGRTRLFDGALGESNERVGGYCLLDGADRGAALAVAAECPAAAWATVEVCEIGPCLL